MRRADCQQGFGLIESMIGTALLVIFLAAVAQVLHIASQQIGRTRVISTAQRLAMEQLELIRNMDYDLVGTMGGIPDGTLEPIKNQILNGLTFTVETAVVYIDDPYDGIAPTDLYPNDYKRLKVAVIWSGLFASNQPLVYWTDLAPGRLEEKLEGGTIEVTVTNAQLAPLANALVSIEAPTATPSVSLTLSTNSEGKIELPGSPVCGNECYRVTATKPGYTTDRTYSRNEVTNPMKPDLSVLNGGISQVTLTIDAVSTVSFRAVRTAVFGYSPFQGVQFRLTGSKLIGRDALDLPVYKYSALKVTGSGGVVSVPNLEWDMYTVSIPPGSSVDFAGSTPVSPFSLNPGVNGNFTLVVAPATDNTLLVVAQDNSGNLVASGSIELRNDAIGFYESQTLNAIPLADQSQTFFEALPATLNPFQLTLISGGFETVVTQATVSGETSQRFVLTPL